MRIVPWTIAVLLLWASSAAAQTSNGLTEYREGNFRAALPLLRSAVRANPDDADLHAAVLSSLVYLGQYEESMSEEKADAQRFAKSAPVLAACGEYAFYAGDFRTADALWRTALKLDGKNARAVFGLSRLAQAQSETRTARMLIMLAHQYDPEDALITRRFLDYTVGNVRKQLLTPFQTSHPWLYTEAQLKGMGTYRAVQEGLGGKPAFQQQGPLQEQTLHFFPWLRDGRHIFGVGLELKLEGKTFRLLFDTGASGILLDRRAVDKVGLDHIGSELAWGVGDGGKINTFEAIGEDCQIGSLSFSRCVVHSLDQKRRAVADVDGLIGGDVFSDYILDIDFQHRRLHLIPQPTRAPNPQGYDRTTPANEKDFTPVFRFGHHLMLSTAVDNRAVGLFLLDSGSNQTLVDSLFARQFTKLSHNDLLRVNGISGEVKKVYETPPVPLIFARFRTPDITLTALDLNNDPDHTEVRLSGILGFPLMYLFRLQIDYRNGLVKFDPVYSGK